MEPSLTKYKCLLKGSNARCSAGEDIPTEQILLSHIYVILNWTTVDWKMSIQTLFYKVPLYDFLVPF